MREFAQGLIALCIVILCLTVPIAIGDYFGVNHNYTIIVGCVVFLVIAYRVITKEEGR